MATQLFTSTSSAALGYPPNREIGILCDGSLAALDYDGAVTHLYQVTSPQSSPSATSITTFSSGFTPTVASLCVQNNGTTSSDVWVVYASNSNATGALFVAHGTYTPGSGWVWDNTGTKLTTSATFIVAAIVWTGTYLIVGYRHDVSSTVVYANATSTKSGASGWSGEYQLGGSAGGQTHGYISLLHDATNGCALAVYTVSTGTAGQDTVRARVIADGTAPTSQAAWSAETTLSGNINVGAANLTAVLDTANRNLHVAWCDSATTPNPKYNLCTYTTSAVTAGTSFAITGGGGTATTGVMLTLDVASPPTVYLLWASAGPGAASDISYTKISSPYAAGNVGSITNLTNASASDWVYPQAPRGVPVSGYVPLLYQVSNTSPFGVYLDTSISAPGVTNTLGTPARATWSTRTTLQTPTDATFLVDNGMKTLATPARAVFVARAALQTPARATFLNAGTTPGTGIGDIVRSTGTQTANKSGNGYGVGDVTGTEFDYSYKDAAGSGWAIGVNPWYGGLPVSGWYQLDPGLNATLPQKTSANGNQMTLLTTQSGGIVHWEEEVGSNFQASELPTFQNAGGLTELAPANTPFRAYLRAVGDAPDTNNISWTGYVCIYPGDPAMIVFRLDQHNGTGSAISISESDIELIASLLGDSGHNPAGVWQVANGNLSAIGGAATAWGSAGTAQVGTFDYAWITPDSSQSTIILGTGAAVLQPPQTQFGWEATAKYETNDSGPNATKPTRIKFGWYSPTISASIPAGATNTYYVLRVFSRGLTQAVMDAIAADWKTPGTPAVSVGSFTSFSRDERAYVFAAGASNQLVATLDMTGAHVTARHKPVLKITGWTDSGTPGFAWGNTRLVAGTDFRWVYDAPNQTLYVQPWFDSVAGTASVGQRTNAQITLTGAHALGTLTRTAFKTRIAALSTPTRGTFKTRVGLSSPTRARFVARIATLGTPTRAAFQTRLSSLGTPARATWQTRPRLGGSARARFITRMGLLTPTHATNTTRMQLATVNHALFRIPAPPPPGSGWHGPAVGTTTSDPPAVGTTTNDQARIIATRQQ